MNVDLIEMPTDVAREELRKYRTSLHRRADAEYQEIAIGLEHLAKGTPLLQLSRVFADVPLDEKGRPRLAVARADRLRVRVSSYGGTFRFDSAYDQRRGKRPRDSYLEYRSPVVRDHAPTGYAIVPLVPPGVRGTLDLASHLTLWEVERWADTAREVGPDVDPYLLRRVGSDLYAVVGSWDLTPLEQAILSGRRER
jgi:hypothetical protein